MSLTLNLIGFFVRHFLLGITAFSVVWALIIFLAGSDRGYNLDSYIALAKATKWDALVTVIVVPLFGAAYATRAKYYLRTRR